MTALATDEQIAELKAGLDGVTPSEWFQAPADRGALCEVRYRAEHYTGCGELLARSLRLEDAKHIARLSPDRIRALLDRLDAEKARADAAERQVKELTAKLASRHRGIMPKYPPDYPGGFDGPTGAE